MEPREAVLAKASDLITGDRNKTYGSPTQNFEDTAAVWTVQLRNKLKPGEKIDKSDVALLMIALKLVREIADHKADNWVDIAGYAGCGYECAVNDGMTDIDGWSAVFCDEVKPVEDIGEFHTVIEYGDPEPPRDSIWEDVEGDRWSYHNGCCSIPSGWAAYSNPISDDICLWPEVPEEYFPMVRVK